MLLSYQSLTFAIPGIIIGLSLAFVTTVVVELVLSGFTGFTV